MNSLGLSTGPPPDRMASGRPVLSALKTTTSTSSTPAPSPLEAIAEPPSADTTPTRPPQGSRPRKSSSGSAMVLSPLPLNPVFGRREQHRHSKKAEAALELLQELAAEATTSRLDEDEEDEGERGIIANLESRGWIYHGMKESVRIFSREDDDQDRLRDTEGAQQAANGTHKPASTMHGSSLGGSMSHTDRKGKTSQGVRAHESMPFFRGEKYIEGEWKVEDVAATIRSVGARAVWDPRFDPNQSAVVAALSDTDTLAHMHIRGSFPVGERDASVVSTFFNNEVEHVGYLATTSVEDPLIPKAGMRTTIHLHGVCIRAVSQSPYFDPPPVKESPVVDLCPPVQRPSHRRTQSSISLVNGTPGAHSNPLPLYQPLTTIIPPLVRRPTYVYPQSAPPPPPPPLPAPLQQRAFGTRAGMAHHESYGSVGASETQSFAEPIYTLTKDDKVASEEVSTRPGLHVSLIVRASPGGNLPQVSISAFVFLVSYVNQLSLSLPLTLAYIDRYLKTNGFAPYIARRRRQHGLDILEERYDCAAGLYTVIFRVHPSISTEDTRIRFWGSAFNGRFDIVVLRAQNWRLEYDVPPTSPPDIRREEANESTKTLREPRRSSLSVLSSSPLLDTDRSQSPPLSSEHGCKESFDPALLPGPLGGCTLVIPNCDVETGVVSVTISKKSDSARSHLESRIMGEALRAAAKISFEGPQSETIEELLASSSGDQLARACLRNASAVLRQFELGREREKDARSETVLMSPTRLPPTPSRTATKTFNVGGEGTKRRQRAPSVTLSTGLGLAPLGAIERSPS